MKEYFCVTTSFYDDGKVTSAITDTKTCEIKPKNECHETRKCDIYIDWFDTLKEAKQFVKDAKNA